MPSDLEQKPYFASSDLFHPEGLNAGYRIGVLTISGAQKSSLYSQPETDWSLKAGVSPFDNLTELCVEYGLGAPFAAVARLEVIATTINEVLATSEVKARR